MFFSAPGTAIEIIAAYHLTQFSEPLARPGKFQAQNGKPDRNDHKCRPGRNNHDCTQQYDRRPDDANYDASPDLVRHLYGVPDQTPFPFRKTRRAQNSFRRGLMSQYQAVAVLFMTKLS